MPLIKSFVFISLVIFLVSTTVNANENNNLVVSEFEKKIAAYKGKVVYIDFWASWCVPCRKSFPWMEKMRQQYEQKGLKIITINIDSQRSNADNFLAKYPNALEVIYDPKGDIAKQFALKGMPNSFVINKSGQLVSSHVGFNKEKQKKYQKELISLLQDPLE